MGDNLAAVQLNTHKYMFIIDRDGQQEKGQYEVERFTVLVSLSLSYTHTQTQGQ